MKKLKLTGQFKKDLKRYKHQKTKIDKLEVVLGYLVNGTEIPAVYNPHFLRGKYKGYLECHVESDLLLIWLDKETDVITLVRFGSHAELFGL